MFRIFEYSDFEYLFDVFDFFPEVGPKAVGGGNAAFLLCSRSCRVAQDGDHFFAGFFVALFAQALFLKTFPLHRFQSGFQRPAMLLQNLNLVLQVFDAGIQIAAIVPYSPIGKRQKRDDRQRRQSHRQRRQTGAE